MIEQACRGYDDFWIVGRSRCSRFVVGDIPKSTIKMLFKSICSLLLSGPRHILTGYYWSLGEIIMSMAPSIETHLGKTGIDFNLIPHPHSTNSLQTARLAHVAANQVAKAVMTHDGETYRLCLIPSTHRLVLSWLNEHMNGHFRLVIEQELAGLFTDCEVGAVPALGQVYGFPVIWDSAFSNMDEIFFESGDHENLVRVDSGAFMQLMAGQEQDRISCEADEYEFRDELVH